MSLVTDAGKPRSTVTRMIAFQGDRRDRKKAVLSSQAPKKDSILGRKSPVALLEQKPEATATFSNNLRSQAEKLVFEALDELTAVLKQHLSLDDELKNVSISTATSETSKSKASNVLSRNGKTARASVSDPRLYAARMIREAINELSAKLQEEGRESREGSSVSTQISIPAQFFAISQQENNEDSQQNTNQQKNPAKSIADDSVYEVAEKDDSLKSKSQKEVTASYKSADKFSSDEYAKVQQQVSQAAEHRNALAASVRPRKENLFKNIVQELQQVIDEETGQAADISASPNLDLSQWKASKSLSATNEQSVVLNKKLVQDRKSAESLMSKEPSQRLVQNRSKLLSTNDQQSSLTRDVSLAEISLSGLHNKDSFLPEKIPDSNSTASDKVFDNALATPDQQPPSNLKILTAVETETVTNDQQPSINEEVLQVVESMLDKVQDVSGKTLLEVSENECDSGLKQLSTMMLTESLSALKDQAAAVHTQHGSTFETLDKVSNDDEEEPQPDFSK